MKNILLFILLIPVSCFAQNGLNFNKEKQAYEAVNVVTLSDTLTGDYLFKKALEWIAINYKSAKDVIQFSSPEDKKIILKGNYSVSLFMKQGWVKHTLTLEFKDGKYRYAYNDLSYYSPGSGDMPFEGNMLSKKKVLSTTDQKIMQSIKDLTAYIGEGTKKSDW